MRLFIAVHFSDEIRRNLLDAISSLRAQATSANFTRPENLHLTLAFIGETSNTAAVRRVMDAVAAEPLSLTVGGSGRFGDLWWAGVDKNPSLQKLADGLRDGLCGAGFDIDRRAFQPHVTLARRLVSDVPVRLSVPRAAMTVSRVSLMSSERVNGRLVYTEIYGRALS